MRDYLGRELQEGDRVVFMAKRYQAYRQAEIVAFTNQKVVLQENGYTRRKQYRAPERLIKVENKK